jgi:hypothetical protein
MMRHMRLLFAVLMTAGCLAGSDRARAGEAERSLVAGADSGSTVAFLLTISGSSRGVVPVAVSDIRAAASEQLTATLSRRGFLVVAQGEILALMREWRVRDGKAIPRGFLDNLAGDLNVRLLVVVNLVVQHDRLITAARYLDPGSAFVLHVSMTEWPIDRVRDAEGTEWLAAAREAGRTVGEARLDQPDSGRELMLILDTQPVGCSVGEALMASHALLAYCVEHGNRVLIDPAVTNATLHDAGHSERYTGPDARALLQKTFACPRLIISQLISYAPARRPSTQIDAYDELPEQRETIVSDFALSLRLVDLTTGSITAGKEVFLALPAPTGWFGIPRHETQIKRLTISARQLWLDMNNALEGF